MKKMTLFLAFSALLGGLMAQTAADPNFASFASYQDSLMRNAYQQRDITHYRQLLATFLVRYRRLDSTAKKNFSGYQAGAWYNLSCTYALTHQDKPALDCLDSAIKAGWTDYSHTVADEDLTGLHDNPRFTQLLRPLRETYDYGYILSRAGAYNNSDTRPLPAFYYQPASDSNLIALRKGLHLDSIAGGGDDVTRVLHLMHWMHDLIPHDGSKGNPAVKNAMSMIAVCRQNHGTLNCRGLAITLNECLLSLGYRSRYVTCLPKDSLGIDNDCHVIDMVFIPRLHKWIWVDPTFDAYVMNENGEPLGLEEVRQRLIDRRPLILNPDANWNHRNGQSKEGYLYGYMSKNLYRLECAVNSCYDLETNSSGKSVAYVELLPLDYFRQAPDKESYTINGNGHQEIYHTNNAIAFWGSAMRKLLLLLFALPFAAHAQINWKNYSTSFQGNGKEGSQPTLVTAIPYNGIYGGASYNSIQADQLPVADSLRKGEHKWPAYIGESRTIDSNEVYFLAPGLHPANANHYEYRVLLDGHTTIVPWSTATHFTEPGFALNAFAEDFALLGGFKTTWGHSVLVDLREKSTGNILSSALVHWTSASARLDGFYSASNLADLVRSKGTYSSWRTDSTIKHLLEQLVAGKLVLQPNDNTLIFHVGAEIYQKTALEYQLLRGSSIVIPWKPNDFDNDLILLKDLAPGAYTLSIRLRAQRHNPNSYSFTIKPNWYETKFFYALIGFLTVASISGVIAVFTLVGQRRKTRRAQETREKLNLELRSIRAQLNPHFVFNALSSIQGLINKQDTDSANRYLSEFGHLLRDSLAISEKDFTELALEIGIVDTYLKLEQLRFGFYYTIETAPDVDAMATDIPAFLLQPIVENAVKHGVSGLRDQGQVRVRFYREKANFIAEVSDNGAAWDTLKVTSGYGLRLTRERIRLLNQLLKGPVIEMTVVSAPSTATSVNPPPSRGSASPEGTTVKIEFSNWWT